MKIKVIYFFNDKRVEMTKLILKFKMINGMNWMIGMNCFVMISMIIFSYKSVQNLHLHF